jgi:hypothetical protein
MTHEEIVDVAWADEFRPLLLRRYPGLTDGQIKEAHAYAYGGTVIQDLGYYPFGKDFSNLVHYVRSREFVRELLLETEDLRDGPKLAQEQSGKRSTSRLERDEMGVLDR